MREYIHQIACFANAGEYIVLREQPPLESPALGFAELKESVSSVLSGRIACREVFELCVDGRDRGFLLAEIAVRFGKIEYGRHKSVYCMFAVQKGGERLEVAKTAVFIANNEHSEHFSETMKFGLRCLLHVAVNLPDNLHGSGLRPRVRGSAVGGWQKIRRCAVYRRR